MDSNKHLNKPETISTSRQLEIHYTVLLFLSSLHWVITAIACLISKNKHSTLDQYLYQLIAQTNPERLPGYIIYLVSLALLIFVCFICSKLYGYLSKHYNRIIRNIFRKAEFLCFIYTFGAMLIPVAGVFESSSALLCSAIFSPPFFVIMLIQSDLYMESQTQGNYISETTDDGATQLELSFPTLSPFSRYLLLFAFILFAIATNTQSGWLFVLVSVIFSLLLIDGLQVFSTVIRAAKRLKITIKPAGFNQELTPAESCYGYVGNSEQTYTFNLRLDNNSRNNFSNIQIKFSTPNSSLNYIIESDQHLKLTKQPAQESIEPSLATERLLSWRHGLKDNKEALHKLTEQLKQDGKAGSEANQKLSQVEQVVLFDNLQAGKAAELSYKINSQYRGAYSAAPSSLNFSSYLGLVSFTLAVSPSICRLYFAPKVLKLKPGKSPHTTKKDLNKVIPKKSLTETDNLYGLHEFQDGENIRHIHWATSARANELIVREFQAQPLQEKKKPLFIYVAADYNEPTIKSNKGSVNSNFCTLEMALLMVNSAAELCKREDRDFALCFYSQRGTTFIYEKSKISYSLKQFLAEANTVIAPKYKGSGSLSELETNVLADINKKFKESTTLLISLYTDLNEEVIKDTKCNYAMLLLPPQADKATQERFLKQTLQLNSTGIKTKCVTVKDDPKEILEGWI